MSFKLELDSIDRRRLVPALVLIGLGVLGLLGTLGWLGGLGGLVGTVLFGALAYVAHQQAQRTGAIGWRAAVYPLAGLAIAGIAPEPLAGAAFLVGLGIAFLVAYRDDANRWWAIIPAGALLAMGLTALVDDATRGGGGAVFLLGLAATFFVLTRLPQHAQAWAVYPAGALAVLAILALTTGGSWVVPVVLIAVGAWMLLKPETAREVRESVARTVREATEPRSGAAAAAAPESAATAGADGATGSSEARSAEPQAEPHTEPNAEPHAEPRADSERDDDRAPR